MASFPSFTLCVGILMICTNALPAGAADESLLKSLHKEHPRIFLHKEDIPRLREAIARDPVMKRWHERLVADATKILDEKPIEHRLIGPRLLDKSRTCLRRVSTLAGLYLLDGDRRFAERARTEMFTAAAFKDWNPSHFLDTAEMSAALGIGYDWLYEFLSAEDRKTIREGLIRLGLAVGLEGFEKRAWWTRATHNWSQVCNGGLTVGALAIADEEPALAEKLLSLCREAIRPSMRAFAPDGGFAEGPGYWGYATQYNVYYLAALETALGTDFGLKQMPGFAQTGFFRMHSAGPVGKSFNYADAGENTGTAAQMFWLARAFKEPAFTTHELAIAADRPSIFHLLWLERAPREGAAEVPLDALFRGVNVAIFRSAWNDRNAVYVGIKGGDNRANHSHLDLGSFVMDALGYRWAVDLGPDDYNLPGYFGNKRWTYYRLRTESHNTLTLDGENQSPDGKAPVVAYMSGTDRSHVVIDLSHGYRNQAGKVMRGLAVLNRSAVLVQDEIEAAQPVAVVWNFLTPAKIEIAGDTARLSQGSAAISVRIIEPSGAAFKIVSANPPPPQRQQPGIQNLTVQLPRKAQSTRIAVLISTDRAPAIRIEPLDKWSGALQK